MARCCRPGSAFPCASACPPSSASRTPSTSSASPCSTPTPAATGKTGATTGSAGCERRLRAPALEVGPVVLAAPVAQTVGAGRRLGRQQAVVPGKTRERQLEDDLARPLRPALGTLGRLEANVETAHVEEDPGQLRSHGRQRAMHAG